jgi:hypothetical protein
MEVVDTDALTAEQKLEILKRWEAEARDLQVASEENMVGGEDNGLIDVRKAIDSLSRKENLSENDGRGTPGPSKSHA